MTWVPIFDVSSKDFEKDINSLKKIFGDFERQTRFKDGYRFSANAQFGMGWWFYTVYAKIGFIKELINHQQHSLNPKVKNERKTLLELVEKQLRSKKSTAKIRSHGKKPLFAGYWSWLMR